MFFLLEKLNCHLEAWSTCTMFFAFLICSDPTNTCDTFTTINIPPYNLVLSSEWRGTMHGDAFNEATTKWFLKELFLILKWL